MTTNQRTDKGTAKTVLITGASSGIGEEIAYASARKGYQLILWARREKELERVASTCRDLSGKKVLVQSVDIRSSTEIEDAFHHALDQTGAIDILINNAGFGMTHPFVTSDLTRAKDMFDVNVMGAVYLTQLVASQMVEQRRGHIFFVASIAGKISTPLSSIYSATKAALIAFANGIRLELKPLHIYVTTINPGPVATPFFDSFDPDGTYLKKIGPVVLDAREVAQKTVDIFGKNKRELNLPFAMAIGARLYPLFPSIGDFLIVHLFDKK